MKRILSFLTVCIILLITSVTFLPVKAHEQKIVRVGWYESTYCYTDAFGRRGGMVYEYQQKIAAHTGWVYEYVEESWPNLLQMLKDGKIDLLSDVSYTEERADQMLYPSLEMGTEWYCLYIDADNSDIHSEDLMTFNGKKIGVNKDSLQEELLKEWLKRNNIQAEIVPLSLPVSEATALLTDGSIDAYVTLDSINSVKRMLSVGRIGSSDYYFAISKERPDLLKELNFALNRIQSEDPNYNKKMMEELVRFRKTNAFLDEDLEEWIVKHGPIRIGYIDDFLPFCATDKATGEVTGALKDYLAKAANSMKNVEIKFETVPYFTVSEALEAMQKGTIDCVFPVNFSTYDGEVMGLFTIAPIMRSEMSILISKDSQFDTITGKSLNTAIVAGDVGLETFIKDDAPEWTILSYSDMESCCKAVASKEADAVLVYSYRVGFSESMISRYKLTIVPTGSSINLSFSVGRSSRELYAILDKIENVVSNEDMDFILASYMYSSSRTSLIQFLGEHWIAVLLVVSIIFAGFLFLLFRKLKAEKQVNEQQKQIEEALRRELNQQKKLQFVTQKAYTDPLTGVKSKQSYVEAEERMNRRMTEKSVSAFRIVVFDLNGLKVVNDTQGHQAGDQYIKDACRIICVTFKHSPVYRIGGDEFVAIMEGEDYDNRDTLLTSFEKKMDDNLAQGKVNIAHGWSDYSPETDNTFREIFERADEKMYERKKQMKKSV